MSTYRVLFLGDIVGEPGRAHVQRSLPSLREMYTPTFVIVNGENAAAGSGITPKIADALFSWGVDAITLGNHAFHKREIAPYLDGKLPIVRPMNMTRRFSGRGFVDLHRDGIALRVANLCGRVHMEPAYDDPFGMAEDLWASDHHLFLDFHAEATSEKIAMGWHCDGHAVAVVGTHTHVQTADERVLPNGTAYITDVGMCGPSDGVLGVDRDVIVRRFRGDLHERFEVAPGPSVICGVVIDVKTNTGHAVGIERIRFGD